MESESLDFFLIMSIWLFPISSHKLTQYYLHEFTFIESIWSYINPISFIDFCSYKCSTKPIRSRFI